MKYARPMKTSRPPKIVMKVIEISLCLLEDGPQRSAVAVRVVPAADSCSGTGGQDHRALMV
jgi:hypothetical protein